jgi:integrase/recombinase XerD
VGDIHQREGLPHLRVEGKGDKVRYVPLYVLAQRLMTAYMEASGHAGELYGLLRLVKNNHTRTLAKPLHSMSVYRNIVKRYARELGLTGAIPGFCVHSLRAAATNALARGAEIAKVQEWRQNLVRGDDRGVSDPFVRAVHFHVPLRKAIDHLL